MWWSRLRPCQNCPPHSTSRRHALVHPVGGLCGRGRVIIGNDQADDLDPAVKRTVRIDVDLDRLVLDQVGYVIPHEVVARDPVLMIIVELVGVAWTTAESGVVVPEELEGIWIQNVIKPGMPGLRPYVLVLAVTIPIKTVGDRERFVFLHVSAVCRDIEPGPRDPTFFLDRGCRQRECPGHVLFPPSSVPGKVKPEVAGHGAGLHCLKRDAAHPSHLQKPPPPYTTTEERAMTLVSFF